MRLLFGWIVSTAENKIPFDLANHLHSSLRPLSSPWEQVQQLGIVAAEIQRLHRGEIRCHICRLLDESMNVVHLCKALAESVQLLEMKGDTYS